MSDSNRADEKKILESINHVVQILIELSYTRGSKKNILYDDAVLVLRNIRPNLLGLIDGRNELLESLTKQLISQKLPHPFIFNSFGDLQRDLNHILALTFSPCNENSNVVDYTEKSPTVQQDNDKFMEPLKPSLPEQIEKTLQQIFTGEIVHKDYSFRNLHMDYFIPAKKIGVVIKTSPVYRRRFYEFFLKKEGISLLEIDGDDLHALANLKAQLYR